MFLKQKFTEEMSVDVKEFNEILYYVCKYTA